MMMELGEVIVSHNDSPSSKAMRPIQASCTTTTILMGFLLTVRSKLASMTPDLLSRYYNGILTRGLGGISCWL